MNMTDDRGYWFPPTSPFGLGWGAVVLANCTAYGDILQLLLDGTPFFAPRKFGGKMLNVDWDYLGLNFENRRKTMIIKKRDYGKRDRYQGARPGKILVAGPELSP